jgi:hypothetical protein
MVQTPGYRKGIIFNAKNTIFYFFCIREAFLLWKGQKEFADSLRKKWIIY